jgi:hypothetical protein
VAVVVLAGILVAPGSAVAEDGEAPEQTVCPLEVAGDDQPAAADEVSASLLAQACDVPVEDMSARSYDSRSWVQPDGAVLSELYGRPRVFRTVAKRFSYAAICRFRYSSWTSCGVL